MPRNTNGKGFSLKDELFNRKKVQFLAAQFQRADESFDAVQFEKDVMKKLTKLELKARIVWIAENLESYLSKDFSVAAKQIVAALPPKLDPGKGDDDFGDFILAPLGEYVVRNGLTKKHLVVSLKTLSKITQRFSMEDAIRYFINAFPVETMKELEKWSHDTNYHVRRLVSEGTRHLLPWSGRIDIPVTAPLQLLDILHADKTRYVTRSVANHMNDIAKVNPVLVVTTLKRWQKDGNQDVKELDWIVQHALRTLIKDGNRDALALIGYHATPDIVVGTLHFDQKEIDAGETLTFSCDITAQKDENLLIDYIVDFVKANGSTAPKVFKLKKIALKKEEKMAVMKKHRFLADTTTRTLYPGVHAITLQINGQQYSTNSFRINV